MAILRRALLVGLVLIAPSAVTALLFVASEAMLHATHRVVEPQLLWYAAAIELPVFLVFAVLDAKNRW